MANTNAGEDSPAAAASHTRTYQACIPCRKRKVRCDLGPVDNPHEPPCVRCRRESKECYFSAQRRKKRALDSGADDELEGEEFELRGGRKRLKGDGDDDLTPQSATAFSAYPVAPASSASRSNTFRRPHPPGLTQQSLKDEQDDEQVNSQTAAILQTAEIHGGHDALNVLFEAATHLRTNSTSSTRPSGLLQGYTSTNLPSVTSPPTERRSIYGIADPSMQPQIDPAIQHAHSGTSAADMISALSAWRRFKFVRSGWFSAQEGIQYIEYFYNKLSPLTPIVMPDYGSPGKHAKLLAEEPMLVVTILTIASRHMPLEGPGSQSRPAAIHQTLWIYLEGMINRLVWGQEQFGRSSHGALPGADVNPYTRKGLRTLGTVESLMLLTEWHPRSMHFPGIDDDSELLAPERYTDVGASENGSNESTKGIGGHRIDTWLEPCWRSDRICWMLLSMAMALAMEVGVFDEDISRHMFKDPNVSLEMRETYERRRVHVKNLLLIYTTQTSGRVGLTSMLPEAYSEPALSAHFHPSEISHGSTKDLVIHLWLRIASISKTSTKDLFGHRDQTRELIRSGRYKRLLHDLHPLLTQWKQTFESAKDIPLLMRHILIIEYEYARVYINSLGLQAVVERCTQNTPKQMSTNPDAGQNNLKTTTTITPATLERWLGEDRYYVKEVVDSCQGLLRAVVEGLRPKDNLRHAPVRTYFRIVSVAIILLKTFALGASEDDVAKSLGLMDGTVEALRTSIVDDVHVASRFADLLDTLTKRIRTRFVRMARNGANSSSRDMSDSPVHQMYVPGSSAQHSNLRNTPLSWQQNQSRNMAMHQDVSQNDLPPSHPLSGISQQAYDYNDSNVPYTLMPPPTNPPSPGLGHPTIGNGGYGPYGQADNGGYDDGTDWLALPLDPIIASVGGNVRQTGYGPEVNGYDMLELLLGNNYDPGN
ncbi:hypothetical protein MBLNU457_5870t1 [Dothideomycetes sp. NU457]